MKIKLFIIMFALVLLIPFNIKASSNDYEVYLNGKLYNTLEDALEAANPYDTIKLMNDVNLDTTLNIFKNITLDLNGNDIESKQRVINIVGAEVIIKGSGTIKELVPDYYAISLKGSNNKEDTNYSKVVVGENVTLEAWAPIFITPTENNHSYGVVADIYGTLIGKKDSNNYNGAGIYINGNVRNKENYPIINIHDNSKIDSIGVGLYIAGYSKVNISKASIKGIDAGIAIKSGILNLKDTNVLATGLAKEPVGNSNGVNATGSAIQIESNKDYVGDIQITIDNGRYESKNSYAVLEYLASNTTTTSVNKLDINDGIFISKDGLEAFKYSSDLQNKDRVVVNLIDTNTPKNNTANNIIILIIFSIIGIISYLTIKKIKG